MTRWSETAKLDRFWLEFSALIPRLGGAKTMKASKFSDAQKAFILKQGADGVPVAEICRKAGISQATYFNWKKKYDGLLPTEMRRLKQLEDENEQAEEDCRRPVAGQGDAAGRHPPKTVRPVRKRKLVDEMRGEWDVSIRRACRVLRSTRRPIITSPVAPEQADIEQPDKGDLRDARALRLSARACVAAP